MVDAQVIKIIVKPSIQISGLAGLSVLPINTEKTVKFRVSFFGPSARNVTKVTLYQVNRDGKILGAIGEMSDQGNYGDDNANDLTWTRSVTTDPVPAGYIYFRAIAETVNTGTIMTPIEWVLVSPFATDFAPHIEFLYVTDAETGLEYAANQLGIEFTSEVSNAEMVEIVATIGATIVYVSPHPPSYTTHFPAVGTMDQLKEKVSRLKQDPGVERVTMESIWSLGPRISDNTTVLPLAAASTESIFPNDPALAVAQ